VIVFYVFSGNNILNLTGSFIIAYHWCV
jgi:hypothetical protein